MVENNSAVLQQTVEWQELEKHYKEMKDKNIKGLFEDSERFNKFSAEPAAERQYINNDYVKSLKEQRFSKLEALKALKNKNK